MTYNQIIQRMQRLALGHRQVRTFKRGFSSDMLTEKAIKYSAIFVQDAGGNVSLVNNQWSVNFRVHFLDMVHVSAHAKQNEQDVISDELSIALDYIAQLSNPNYNDWKITTSNLFPEMEQKDDMLAGCYADITISSIFSKNVCQIPTDIDDYEPETDRDMNVYDLIWRANGDEGTTITVSDIPELAVLAGKKILLITREYSPLYKVRPPATTTTDATEYYWNDIDLVLGMSPNPGERFLFLYRNY